MINLHESMVPGRDRTRDPWICSQTRICSQARYRLRYAARFYRLPYITLPNDTVYEMSFNLLVTFCNCLVLSFSETTQWK